MGDSSMQNKYANYAVVSFIQQIVIVIWYLWEAIKNERWLNALVNAIVYCCIVLNMQILQRNMQICKTK